MIQTAEELTAFKAILSAAMKTGDLKIVSAIAYFHEKLSAQNANEPQTLDLVKHANTDIII